MNDNIRLVVAALIFISAAFAIAAVCYRLLYARKPGRDPASPLVPLAPPIGPGSPVPNYSTTAAPQAPAKARSWSENWAIHDEQSARKAARQAMWAAFCVAVVTGVAAFLAGSGIATFKEIGVTAWVDAVLFAVLGLGIWRMSRVAAVAALVLYIAERIAMAHVTGLSPVMMIAMVSCFVQGVRGTWAFHNFRRQTGTPNVIASPQLSRVDR